MSASVLTFEDMDNFPKTTQRTQLVNGTGSICPHSPQVPLLDFSLRSCDAFVSNIKEEVEDSEYYGPATVCSKPVQSSPEPQPIKMPLRQPTTTNFHFCQIPPKTAGLYPFPGFHRSPGYPVVPGCPMSFVPHLMTGAPQAQIPRAMLQHRKTAHGSRGVVSTQMYHPHLLLPTMFGVRTNVNQVQQQPESTLSSPPSLYSQKTVASPIKASPVSVPFIKEEPLDGPEDQVDIMSTSPATSPVVLSGIAQIPEGYMSYPSPYPFMGLPFQMHTHLQMKRRSPTIGRKDKLQKEEDKKDFINLYKSVEVAALVGKHPVLLYKFKKDDDDYCYPFTRKRVNQSGEVYSCSNCKKLGEKESFIRVKNGYFQSNPVEGHGPTCEPKKWIEEMAKRMTYKTTQRVKMNDYDVDTKEIHSQMCADVLTNDFLNQEEKIEVFNIIGNFPNKCRSIARARKMSKQRQDEQQGLLNEMMARQLFTMMFRPQG